MKKIIVILFVTIILVGCNEWENYSPVNISPVAAPEPTPTPENVCIFSMECFYR